MIEELQTCLTAAVPLHAHAMEQAKNRWDHVAKPLHSLGILEDDVVKIAGICGSSMVNIEKRGLLILCGDNGIVEEGVTQTGQEVTAVVVENMTNAASSVCIMANLTHVDIYPVDMGVARDLCSGSAHPLINRKIAYGTKNFYKEPAMTRKEALTAIEIGAALVKELAEQGYGLIATGEMGIGNTTTSSAVASMLLHKEPEEMTGRGAGLTDAGLVRKTEVIRAAIDRWKGDCKDPVDVLAKVGGFDLAGLAGVFLGGAMYHVPILVDGFISATAAVAAEKILPGTKNYMLASHVSAEPAGRILLDYLGISPVIQAGMCLGEGTGAVAAIPLLDMAVAVYHSMSTFEEISIEDYKPLGGEGCSD